MSVRRISNANKFLRKCSAVTPDAVPEEAVSTVPELPGPGFHPKDISPVRPSQPIAVLRVITGSYVNSLLVVFPVAVASHIGDWGDMPVFVLNFLALVPLANILGEATETLAEHCGDTIGGLINATFGNAVEVIIAVFALKKGEIALVQSSLVGSLLSNLLMVLGSCFVAAQLGGHHESAFNQFSAGTNMALLFVTSFAMLVPSYYQFKTTDDPIALAKAVLAISRISALFLIVMYIQLLVFQLWTHKDDATGLTETLTNDVQAVKTTDDHDGGHDHHEPELSFWSGLLLLGVATVLVAVLSEFLVASVDGFTKTAGISHSFVGIILLPIVGNAVEHVTAIKVAYKNNMELALGVAVGSAAQISLFVVPFTVLAGWIMDQPMSLAFPTFELVTYVSTVVIVYVILIDGRSHWLEGSMLLTLYCLIGVALLEVDVA
ncbi:Aste57867_21684 [Aphanomyces stellatus]|uniref:Aste57867_21684 protein n=1 Tax=Aphanomyces stellatus TaxID=120398 RepID=A0A485LN03_9STRA|nr:hypothetical protein As57867_021615 [Aphanomyces stellatus]VFT98353.1 Aste57867_21684 [Aphanomyces stellatus]